MAVKCFTKRNRKVSGKQIKKTQRGGVDINQLKARIGTIGTRIGAIGTRIGATFGHETSMKTRNEKKYGKNTAGELARLREKFRTAEKNFSSISSGLYQQSNGYKLTAKKEVISAQGKYMKLRKVARSEKARQKGSKV